MCSSFRGDAFSRGSGVRTQPTAQAVGRLQENEKAPAVATETMPPRIAETCLLTT